MEEIVFNHLTKASLSLPGQDPALPFLFYSFLITAASSDLSFVVYVSAVFERALETCIHLCSIKAGTKT